MTRTDNETRALIECIGCDAYDINGEKIGRVAEIYADHATGQPEWLALTAGFLGSRTHFVPLAGASAQDEGIIVAFERDAVHRAPNTESHGELTQEDEAQLYGHYGFDYSYDQSQSGLPGQAQERDMRAKRAGDTGTGEMRERTTGDEAMTRSEEELQLERTRRDVGRARLYKWVEVEHVSFTVPVRRQKAKLVREPITDDNRDRAFSGPEISEGEHEVVLNEEDVVVTKRVEPKERVRLETEEVVEERAVEADLAKERIEFDDGTSRDQPALAEQHAPRK